MPKWKNEETGEVIDYTPPAPDRAYPPIEMDDHAPADITTKEGWKAAQRERAGFGESALKQVFSSFPGKTLKLKVKTGETLERSVLAAYRYVSNPQQEYSRIEFRYGDCYIVVARLKEEKD